MTHASLFSGIGGPEVAAAMLGWNNAFHCEINDFCRKILEYHFPNSKSYIDVTKTDFTEWRGRIDVLTGGFPCQPFSYAGERRGAEDDRYLWPEFKRVISEVRPTWVVGENVSGITTMVEPGEVSLMGSEASLFSEEDIVHRYLYEQPFTIERVCSDFEQLGYTVQPMLIPACAVGAPHRRDRVFFIAYSEDAMHLRCSEREDEECINSGEQRHAGTGDSERNGGEERTITTNAEKQPGQRVRPQQRETCGEEQVEFGGSRGEDGSEPDATHTCNARLERRDEPGCEESGERVYLWRYPSGHRDEGSEKVCGLGQWVAPHTESNGSGRKSDSQDAAMPRQDRGQMAESDINGRIWGVSGSEAGGCEEIGQRWANFPTVSPVHRGNDGLPFPLGNLTIPFSRWRTESLKAYGNAIVPQVMYEIFRAIELTQ